METMLIETPGVHGFHVSRHSNSMHKALPSQRLIDRLDLRHASPSAAVKSHRPHGIHDQRRRLNKQKNYPTWL